MDRDLRLREGEGMKGSLGGQFNFFTDSDTHWFSLLSYFQIKNATFLTVKR